MARPTMAISPSLMLFWLSSSFFLFLFYPSLAVPLSLLNVFRYMLTLPRTQRGETKILLMLCFENDTQEADGSSK